MPLSPPAPLAAGHDCSAFASGESSLDDWLKRRALANQASGATRTYAVCEGARVVGYYALAAGAVVAAAAPGRVRRNMPDPIPVMVLARLAVDRTMQGRGLGRALLADAMRRTLAAAEIAGLRAIVVHALTPAAADFYRGCGFIAAPGDPMTLFLPLQDIARALGSG